MKRIGTIALALCALTGPAASASYQPHLTMKRAHEKIARVERVGESYYNWIDGCTRLSAKAVKCRVTLRFDAYDDAGKDLGRSYVHYTDIARLRPSGHVRVARLVGNIHWTPTRR